MSHIFSVIKTFFANVANMVDAEWDYLPKFITQDDPYFIEDTDNGLYLNQIYLPEEVLTIILSHLPHDKTLKFTLVCKKWNRIIKSYPLWSMKYMRKYNRKAKRLPWYLFYSLFTSNYFDVNLLRNNCGQEGFKHWTINVNGGDKFKIEREPMGADPLPLDVPDFNGKKSCFVTSYYVCSKEQLIHLDNNRLFHFILNTYKPHIYVSEWISGRFDCACYYKLTCRLVGDTYEEAIAEKFTQDNIQQWEGKSWEKKEIVMDEYGAGVCGVIFKHKGRDTQFWKGHYGSKMAGGVVKILFDSINPLT